MSKFEIIKAMEEALEALCLADDREGYFSWRQEIEALEEAIKTLKSENQL